MKYYFLDLSTGAKYSWYGILPLSEFIEMFHDLSKDEPNRLRLVREVDYG